MDNEFAVGMLNWSHTGTINNIHTECVLNHTEGNHTDKVCVCEFVCVLVF